MNTGQRGRAAKRGGRGKTEKKKKKAQKKTRKKTLSLTSKITKGLPADSGGKPLWISIKGKKGGRKS